jgi:hypothetical protein
MQRTGPATLLEVEAVAEPDRISRAHVNEDAPLRYPVVLYEIPILTELAVEGVCPDRIVRQWRTMLAPP